MLNQRLCSFDQSLVGEHGAAKTTEEFSPSTSANNTKVINRGLWPSSEEEDALVARLNPPSQSPFPRARADDNEIIVFTVLHSDDSWSWARVSGENAKYPRAAIPTAQTVLSLTESERDAGLRRGPIQLLRRKDLTVSIELAG
jgi:hypothetical protein